MKYFLISLLLVASFLLPTQAFAQTQTTGKHFLGKVIKIVEERKFTQNDQDFYAQKVEFELEDTKEIITVEVGSEFLPINANQRLQVGKTMVLAEQQITEDRTEVVVVDVYRIPTVLWLFGLFCVLVIVVARWQGVFSLIGMGMSLLVLTNFVVPQIMAGMNPVLITLIGSFMITSVTIYLSHGFSLKSHLALASIILTLSFVALLSNMAVRSAQLAGLGSEEAYYLQFGDTSKINLQGLLLGGIMLAALGVLDDISVAQVALVFEFVHLKKEISFDELYFRAIKIGKDHVASLVNTLVLAYAAANLPLFILFTINKQVPFWVTINSEIILEEVIRTLVGSIGLVLAVPLTTLMTAVAIKIWNLQVPLEKHAHKH